MQQLVPLLTAGMLLVVSTADARNRMDWGPASLRLVPGMTEEEAIKAVGHWPNKAEVKTCGGDTSSGEWTCRILTFGDSYNSLRIYEQLDGQWIVDSWSVYD